MVKACILMTVEPGKYPDVVKKISGFMGVKAAFPVLGRWDVVAQVEARDLAGLGKLALRINGANGVKATETLVGF